MKLNYDCMRDVLLYLEEHLEITPELDIPSISIGKIQNNLEYPIEEIANVAIILTEGGFIISSFKNTCHIHVLLISRITYSGYQLIETIRPQTVWKKIKSTLMPIGSFSISLILQVGSEIITSFIAKKTDL